MKRVVGEFVAHLLVGAALFLVLLLVAAGLSLAAHGIAVFVGDPFFVAVAVFTERVLLVIDVALLVYWSLYAAYSAAKEINHE